MSINEPLLLFDYEKAEELEGYQRQLQTLYTTVEGTCPGDRHFGLSPEYQDESPPVAESTLSLEIYNKTEEYVPQVEVLDIQFTYGEEGQMIPQITIGLNEEYDEEEYEEEE